MNTAAERELNTSRLIKATPAQIFQAFTEPERLARWWGPNGFTNTFHEFECTSGGVWRFDMNGPDGKVYPNEIVFNEVSPQRIVLHHLASMHVFTLTITMVEEGDATRLSWRQAFETAAECDKVRPYAPRCNEENLDRLESELARMMAGEREMVLMRILDAPREKLFRCWTEPQLITKWFTPPPYVTTHAEIDLRVGGSSLVVMRSPEGVEIPNRGVYLEVVPKERLVFTDAYTKAWEPSEKPFMTGTLTFEDLGGRTRYTARVTHWSAADREAHEKMGFYQGWGIATDQLLALAKELP